MINRHQILRYRDTVDTNSWVKGKIIFTNATAEEIFRTLERRYDTVIDHSTDFSASRRTLSNS